MYHNMDVMKCRSRGYKLETKQSAKQCTTWQVDISVGDSDIFLPFFEAKEVFVLLIRQHSSVVVVVVAARLWEVEGRHQRKQPSCEFSFWFVIWQMCFHLPICASGESLNFFVNKRLVFFVCFFSKFGISITFLRNESQGDGNPASDKVRTIFTIFPSQ